jgi:hypothetical protein
LTFDQEGKYILGVETRSECILPRFEDKSTTFIFSKNSGKMLGLPGVA